MISEDELKRLKNFQNSNIYDINGARIQNKTIYDMAGVEINFPNVCPGCLGPVDTTIPLDVLIENGKVKVVNSPRYQWESIITDAPLQAHIHYDLPCCSRCVKFEKEYKNRLISGLELIGISIVFIEIFLFFYNILFQGEINLTKYDIIIVCSALLLALYGNHRSGKLFLEKGEKAGLKIIGEFIYENGFGFYNSEYVKLFLKLNPNFKLSWGRGNIVEGVRLVKDVKRDIGLNYR
jgi:hypothetical protein